MKSFDLCNETYEFSLQKLQMLMNRYQLMSLENLTISILQRLQYMFMLNHLVKDHF